MAPCLYGNYGMANAENKAQDRVRTPDRLDLNPRFSEADALRLNQLFRGTSTQDMLSSVLNDGLAGDVALVSSFGAESAVLLHLVTQARPDMPVLFLDTGKHFAETLAYRETLTERLGLNIVLLSPDPVELLTRDESGLRWSYDPDGCCDLRKVRPLARALARYDASMTGRKGFQASTRSGLPRFEIDNSDAQGRLKINPLASWSKDDLNAYFDAHALPRHPLEAQGYPSIGCSPCTSKVAAGEDPRAGRWRGWDKTECGIHEAVTPIDDNPANDPAF